MEHVNSVMGRPGEGSPFVNNGKNNRGVFKVVLQHILLANYSLSVYLNNWREELYTTLAVKITCFELFTVIITLQYIFYPKLKKHGRFQLLE